VPCSTVVDLAKAVSTAAGSSTCKAVQEISKARAKDAENSVHKVLAKYNLALPIPLSPVEGTTALDGFPRLKPLHFLEHMLETGHLNKLLGGRSLASSGPMLLEFWQNYRCCYPDFELYELADGKAYGDGPPVDLSCCIPVYAHIDGGRGFKRSEFLVFNWSTVIGHGTGKQNRKDPSVPIKRNAKKPQVGLLGHSFLTHYLYCAMPASMHKNKEADFQEILQVFAMDLRKCFDSGVQLKNGSRLRLVLLGLKGDLKLQASAGRFTAWYSTARKKAYDPNSGKPQAKGRCCPWCPAGDPEAPFEEFHSENPAWKVMKQQLQEPPPWDEPGGMLGASLAYTKDPTQFYFPDLFHIYLMGIGQDFASSCLVYLLGVAFKGPVGRNKVDDQIEVLNRTFTTWRKMFKASVHLTAFTKGTLTFPDYSTFPAGTWSKAGDTPQLIKFIGYVCSLWPELYRQDKMIYYMEEACAAVGACMRRLYDADLWIVPGLE
ncbi:unnamed protein product, partial [Symbiodinium microadriaticum]